MDYGESKRSEAGGVPQTLVDNCAKTLSGGESWTEEMNEYMGAAGSASECAAALRVCVCVCVGVSVGVCRSPTVLRITC